VSLPITNRPLKTQPVITRPEALKVAVDNWTTWHAEHGDKKVLLLSELLTRPTPPELVDDLLVSGSLATLVSAAGVGKSFVALDLALSIATGRSTFLGRPLRITEPCPVFYVIGEGAGRFNLRVKAWQQYHGVAGDGFEFHTQTEPVDLFDPKEVQRFIDTLRAIGPKLVVLDTLSRCIPGKDENAQSVMSEVVEVLDRIKASLHGCTVMPLHHLNASGTRERGSSVLRAGVDSQLLLRPRKKADGTDDDDDTVDTTSPTGVIRFSTKAPIGKQKDLDELSKAALLTKQEIVLVDVYGQPVTDVHGRQLKSLVLTPLDHELRHRVVAYTNQNPDASRRDVYGNVTGKQAAIRDVLDEIGFKLPSEPRKAA
jgi:hypothetical protein